MFTRAQAHRQPAPSLLNTGAFMKVGSRLISALLCVCVAMIGSIVATARPAAAVVGGTVTDVADYPYFASFTQPYGLPPSCGGSVIADSWVLTAAHCVNGLSSVTIEVPAAGTTTVGEVLRDPLWVDGSSH